MNRRLPRVASVILLAGALLGGLSACYVGPANGDCVRQAKAGSSSEAVTASGAVLNRPTVSFPTPLRPKTVESSTLTEGRGQPIQGDQYVAGYLTLLNGTTGQVLDQSDYSGKSAPASFVIDKLPIPGLSKGLQCAKVDGRVAVVIPGKEAFAKSSPPTGMSANDSIVVVVDFKAAYLSRAQGIAQVAQAGLPSVVLAPDGRPGITVPAADPPAKLQVADLIAGNGATVKSGDSVLVNYTGVIWKTGTVFDSSWETGKPITAKVTKGQAIAGFLSALKGQKVGSQVLAVIPPDQGYGKTANGSIPANSTLVFVVDILGIVK
jgi:FKBP-type peptidyl-prolyl cis-trans isomerase